MDATCLCGAVQEHRLGRIAHDHHRSRGRAAFVMDREEASVLRINVAPGSSPHHDVVAGAESGAIEYSVDSAKRPADVARLAAEVAARERDEKDLPRHHGEGDRRVGVSIGSNRYPDGARGHVGPWL